jgi:hypothetical protein
MNSVPGKAVVLGLAAAAMLWPCGGPAQQPSASITIFFFVDEHGVEHYSNHPSDPRYRPLGPVPTGVSLTADHDRAVARSAAESASLRGGGRKTPTGDVHAGKSPAANVEPDALEADAPSSHH